MNPKVLRHFFAPLVLLLAANPTLADDPVMVRAFCSPPVTNGIEEATWYRPVITGTGLALTRNGEKLALTIATAFGQVGIYRTSDGHLEKMLSGIPGTSQEGAFLPNGELLATASYQSVYISRISDGMIITNLNGHNLSGSSVVALSFSPTGEFLASGDTRGKVNLWRMSDGTVVQTISGVMGYAFLAFSPSGRRVATGFASGV